MRILHVVPTYAPAWRYGGPIRSVHGLCRGLVACGHEVHVCTTSVDGDSDSPVELERAVEMDGVQVTYFRSRIGRRLYYAPGMGRWLRAHAGTFDIVHTHSVFLWPTWRAAREAGRVDVPVVLSPRGMLVPELLRARGALRKRIWIDLIERRNLRRARVIHATSEQEASDLRAARLALSSVEVVPNGVDLPTEAGPQERSGILYLGRYSWKKNVAALVEAVALMPGAQLTIAGPDDENMRPQLATLARRLGIEQRVVLTGPVDDATIRELLFSAACVVLPSVNENFGNVVLEAMAHGCPVVVTPGVGARVVVERADAGIVAAGHDAPALADALRRLLESPDLRERAGTRGRAYVASHYTWPVVATQMLRVYARARGDVGA